MLNSNPQPRKIEGMKAMNKNVSNLTLTLLGCVISCGTLAAQTETAGTKTRVTTSISPQKATKSTEEEVVVRAAYDKLIKLNRAAQFSQARPGAPVDENSVIKFELSNFRVGPIKEIALTRAEDFVSLPTGEIVQLIKTETTENDSDPTVSYKAEWTAGQYASIFEPQWTIADVMAFESHKNFDVGEYASYVVTVTLKGKARTYKALALFHNPYKFQGPLKPTFWDSVVGWTGTLTDVWNETLPVTEPKKEPEPTNSSLEIYSSAMATSDDYDAAYVPDDSGGDGGGGGGYEPLGTTSGPIVRRTVEDRREHISGAHGETVGMQGACFDEANNQQRCQVSITDIYTYENGETSNLFYYHSNKTLDKLQTATGSKSTQISCFGARGVGTGNCSIFGCGFTVSWQGSGTSIHLVGGDVWNGEIILNHTCSGGSVAGSSCTTPSFDGSCPIGSTPNGTGLCCFSSTTTTCSLTAINKCNTYGGDFDPFTCRCTGWSPVIIDVNGDGIALTGPADGVDFDLNGNGTRDRLGWTLANSDDAWLALDRNENGNIDNGSELFGNFTAQPAGPNKNGFLALAEFDKAANGGNGDGVLNNHDTVFERLRLWQDSNHNGIVDSGELHTLASRNINELEFDFKESKRTDQFGNEFRYRAKVKDTQEGKVARWAWDVFLSHN